MLSSTYDADGNRKSLSAKIGSTPTPDFVNSYQYDSSNREVQVAQVQATGGDYVEGKLGKFTYDADGETSTIDRLRGASPGTEVVTSTYQYDSFGRTTNLTHSTTPTINDAWTYDADSEVKSFTDSANPGDNFSDCAYDDDGQLKSDTGGFEPVSNTYDDNGNATTGAGDSASAASVAPPVGATTFIVSNDATLSDAVAQIDLIPGGNYVITFSCSSISLCSPLSFYGDGTNVWIIGPGSGSLTINCASGSFAVTGGTTVNISGLTISGETSSFSNDGVLNLSSCTFTNNASDLRCGIYNDLGGSLSATSCTFSDNLGGAFAEIYNDIDCYAAITSCTFSDNVNTANTPGGAIENQGTMNIASSTFSGNSNSDGGAIANEGTLTITSSEFYDNNSSSYGGAISNSGPLSITSCTIADNSAVIGGGINNYDGGTANIAASTISGNTASLEGGGIANYDEAAMPIVNTIVAWNNSATGPDIFDSTGTVTTQNSLVRLAGSANGNQVTASTTTNTIVDEDPLLGSLANNGAPTQTMALLPGSPILDAGIGAYQTKTGPGNEMLFDGTYSYQYDADGNCIAKYNSSNGWNAQIDSTATDITTYTWDNRGRLTAVTTYASYAAYSSPTPSQTVTYTYDMFNNLIGRTVTGGTNPGTQRYVFDGTNMVLAFNGSEQLTDRYLSGPAVDQVLADEYFFSPASAVAHRGGHDALDAGRQSGLGDGCGQ